MPAPRCPTATLDPAVVEHRRRRALSSTTRRTRRRCGAQRRGCWMVASPLSDPWMRWSGWVAPDGRWRRPARQGPEPLSPAGGEAAYRVPLQPGSATVDPTSTTTTPPSPCTPGTSRSRRAADRPVRGGVAATIAGQVPEGHTPSHAGQLDHLAPTAVGTGAARPGSVVEGRRLTFSVSASDQRGLIAAGRSRVVVDVESSWRMHLSRPSSSDRPGPGDRPDARPGRPLASWRMPAELPTPVPGATVVPLTTGRAGSVLLGAPPPSPTAACGRPRRPGRAFRQPPDRPDEISAPATAVRAEERSGSSSRPTPWCRSATGPAGRPSTAATPWYFVARPAVAVVIDGYETLAHRWIAPARPSPATAASSTWCARG
jgi:hypothetical protein